MSLTGNELVTADGLKALHDYNEEAFLKLDGVGGAHNLKIYTKFEQLNNNLSNQSTIMEILDSMPFGSKFSTTIWGGSTSVYPTDNGVLDIEDNGGGYVSLTFTERDTENNPRQWYGSAQRGQYWSGWKKVICNSEMYSVILNSDYTSILDWATKNYNTIGLYQGNGFDDCPFDKTHWGLIVSLSHVDYPQGTGGLVIATGNEANEIYVRKVNYNTGEWFNNWRRIGDFTADGSVPMTGTLQVNNGYGRFLADTGYAQITTTEEINNTDNCRGLVLKNSKAEGNVRNTAQIFDKVDGTVTYYQLFGQHNTDLLASTIQSLIDEGKITFN